MHPFFPEIMDECIHLRNEFFPDVKIAVLSNSTNIGDIRIFSALKKADMNILKLDSAVEKTINFINCPRVKIHAEELISRLESFKGELIIQTLFFKASYKGQLIDNSAPEELEAWLKAVKRIKPSGVMIYSLARDTAVHGLEAIPHDVLLNIAEKVEKAGINTQVNP